MKTQSVDINEDALRVLQNAATRHKELIVYDLENAAKHRWKSAVETQSRGFFHLAVVEKDLCSTLEAASRVLRDIMGFPHSEENE